MIQHRINLIQTSHHDIGHLYIKEILILSSQEYCDTAMIKSLKEASNNLSHREGLCRELQSEAQ